MNIGKYNPYAGVTFFTYLMVAFIYVMTSLYKLMYNKALTAAWTVCEIHFLMEFYHLQVFLN